MQQEREIKNHEKNYKTLWKIWVNVWSQWRMKMFAWGKNKNWRTIANKCFRSENQVLGKYIEQLMAASSVFHSSTGRKWSLIYFSQHNLLALRGPMTDNFFSWLIFLQSFILIHFKLHKLTLLINYHVVRLALIMCFKISSLS